jgi:hypothetical protein
MDEFDPWVDFNCLNKFVISLSGAIGALSSPLGPHLKSDLATDLYYVSTIIVNMNESDRINFNRLNESMISLSVAIRASGCPVGPRPERDIYTYLYFGSITIAIKERVQSSDHFKTISRNLQHHYKR